MMGNIKSKEEEADDECAKMDIYYQNPPDEPINMEIDFAAMDLSEEQKKIDILAQDLPDLEEQIMMIEPPNDQNCNDQTLSYTTVEYVCPFCSSSFGVSENAISHIVRHLNEVAAQPETQPETAPKAPTDQLFQCEKCNAEFIYKHTLKLHLKKFHFSHVNWFSCKICGKGFKAKAELVKHRSDHKCSYCQETLPLDVPLKIHVRDNHKGLPVSARDGPISKQICCVLLDHMEIQHYYDAREAEADSGVYFEVLVDFGDVYPAEDSNGVAMNTTNESTAAKGSEDSFACPECPEVFRTESAMIRHLLKTEKINCDVCDKVFASRRSLAAHSRHHVKRNVHSVMSRVKKTHPRKPQTCPYCNSTYKHKYFYTKHIRTTHRGLPITIHDGPVSKEFCSVLLERLFV
ncbi:zinc finger protein 836-like [Phlebotomus argentipes]|uniref:zinc finger protein 836-like n=1 Tax=Phlebotomus argentipes TaxID=94469 RepID=UPI00289378E3|nr:zinc finger protein 836-like [Phlebotomus argentipes]